MKNLFLTYLNAGISGSVIILVCLLLRPIFRKAPRRILCTVWLLAALRLLLPFNIESYFSLQPRYEPLVNLVQEQQPQSPPVQDVPDLEIPDVDIEPILSPQDTPLIPESPKPSPETAMDWAPILSAAWVVVMAGILLYCTTSYIALKHRIRTALRCKDGVLECENISGAFLLGYFKPRIYLPVGLAEKDRAFIIAHEQTHIQRWDHWWKLVGLLCVAVHWYNPLVWIGYALLCRDIEITCDERVIRSMDLQERKAYSQALLNSEKRRFGILECPVAFGEVDLKQRIRNVLAYHPYGYWLTAFAVALVVFVAFCFLTSPVTQPEQGPNLEILVTQPTQPPVTEPSITEPPITDPSGTQPPVTDPPVTEPSVTESPITEPPVTEPSVTEPPITEPPITEPAPAPSVTMIDQSCNFNGKPYYQLTSDGTLTIFGDSKVTDYHVSLWRKHSDLIKKVVITEGVTSIWANTFRDMENLTEVVLCESLTTIGPEAFYECDSLRSIRIPANVTFISDRAFSKCYSLTNVEFAPNSKLTEISNGAFGSTPISSFTTPPNLQRIGSYAFYNCWRLEKVVLTGSVYEVLPEAFSNCDRLKHVVLGASIVEAYHIFLDCDSIEIVENNSAIPFEVLLGVE